MIDKYKREKAARQISEKVVDAKGFDDSKPTHLAFLEGHVDGFNAGAKWAINEFIKSLWHPASEEPELCKRVVVNLKDREGQKRFYISDRDPMFCWQEEVKVCGFIQWLYVDDLLPKEETF